MGQHLVFDIDQIQGFFGNVDIGRRHCRDRISLIEHLFARQHRCAQVFNPHHLFAQIGQLLFGILCQILARDHSAHAVEGFGLARIDGLDPRVCVRASQDFGIEHIGQIEIRAVNRPARHLIRAIVSHGPRTPRPCSPQCPDNLPVVSPFFLLEV